MKGHSLATRRQHRLWLAQHGRKRAYRSHARAWLVIARLCVKDREVFSRRRGQVMFLVPYDCAWTDEWTAGKQGPAHVHIGHQAWRKSRLRRRVHRYVLWPQYRYVIWPYYRARSRWRRHRKRCLAK